MRVAFFHHSNSDWIRLIFKVNSNVHKNFFNKNVYLYRALQTRHINKAENRLNSKLLKSTASEVIYKYVNHAKPQIC